MRYVTLLVKPDGEAFHPVGERLAAAPDLRREAIHRMDPMADGTVVMLAAASGNLDRYREILADSPEVREFAVSGDEQGYSYSRIEMNEQVAYLVDQQRQQELVLDMPIEITDAGDQRVTLIGSEAAFGRVGYDPPEGVDIEIERMGEYHPESQRLLDGLTERQREVLRVAVEEGYYDQPRQVTHAELAAAVDCSPATLGEHLQRIEKSVFRALVG